MGYKTNYVFIINFREEEIYDITVKMLLNYNLFLERIERQSQRQIYKYDDQTNLNKSCDIYNIKKM